MRAQAGLEGLESVLVVDDESGLAAELKAALPAGTRVRQATSLRSGVRLLADAPALVVAEACLPDGDALALVRAARGRSRPPIVIVVSARAGRQLIAALIQDGADSYLEKPVSAVDLGRAYGALRDPEEQVRRMARLLVGRIGLKEAQLCVRGTMHIEALARTGGSRRAAANLLRVHRRYVQRMASELGLELESGQDERTLEDAV